MFFKVPRRLFSRRPRAQSGLFCAFARIMRALCGKAFGNRYKTIPPVSADSYKTERGITVNKLAVLSGVTQSTLNNIVGGRNHSTTVSTLQKVCDGLNITITEFFASDIFAEIEQEIH